MLDSLYQLSLDVTLNSKTEVYSYLAEQIAKKSHTSPSDILQQLHWRESIGSIEIAEGVILPHFESADGRSQIIIIRPKTPISRWSDTIGQVDLIIALVAARQGDKSELRSFAQKLASDDFIDILKYQNQVALKEILEDYNGR